MSLGCHGTEGVQDACGTPETGSTAQVACGGGRGKGGPAPQVGISRYSTVSLLNGIAAALYGIATGVRVNTARYWIALGLIIHSMLAWSWYSHSKYSHSRYGHSRYSHSEHRHSQYGLTLRALSAPRPTMTIYLL